MVKVSFEAVRLAFSTHLKLFLEFSVTEHQKKLIAEQLARKERLARELRAEKGRLEAMKKEVQALAKPVDPLVSPQVCTTEKNMI